MAKGKRLKKAYEGLSPDQAYALEEAVKLLKSRPAAKFDETVELAMNLNIDPRKADQSIRGVISLPHGTGKTMRVAVFARGDKAEPPRPPAPTSSGPRTLRRRSTGAR